MAILNSWADSTPQMKIRGFRVEAEEIETRLVAHPQVTRAIVVLKEHPPGHQRLTAYVVSEGTAPPTGTDLRQFLRQSLPRLHDSRCLQSNPVGALDSQRQGGPQKNFPNCLMKIY